jgi:hypothetical protein
MPTAKKRVFLIDDSPASHDSFGAHKSIAEAILQLVSTERGGRAITLTGAWGSGKSTVVNLILKSTREASIADPANQLEVFVFDAWAHEGDPLRRSFLERLIAALLSRAWIDKQRWKQKLTELERRKKVIDTTSSPVLEGPGIAMLILLYLIPLALVLISTNHFFWHKYRVLSTGLVLYGLPPLLMFFYWLWHRRRPEDERKQTGLDLVGLIVNRTINQTVTETFDSPDPTSVEFQKIFRDLAAEALDFEKFPERKLLLILDNLDRVDASDALKLWSSMSTFLDLPSATAASWAKQLWTLVPLDESAIKRLWDSEAGQSLGESFLAKSFQLRFRVPPPVLSDRTSFFRAQLQKAFPEHEERERYQVSRVFFALQPEALSITPRDIKNFVNQVGASYRSYPEDIPLTVHALYAALSAKSSGTWKAGEAITNIEELRLYVGPDVEESLSAVYFNVPRAKALQVLLGARIEKYLAEGNSTELGKLAGAPGVDEVILQIVNQGRVPWVQNDPFRIGRAAVACHGLGDQLTMSWEEVWTTLERAARETQQWRLLDHLSGQGLVILIQNRKEVSFTRNLLHSLGATGFMRDMTADQKRQWLVGVLVVLNGVLESDHKELLEEFRVGATPAEYLAVLQVGASVENLPILNTYLQPGFDRKLVIGELQVLIESGSFAPYEIAIELMVLVRGPWNWIPLIDSMKSHFQGQYPSQEIGAYVRALFNLTKTEALAQNVLQPNTTNGWMFHHLQACHNGNHYESTASCLLAIIMFEPEAGGNSNPISAAQGRITYRSYMANIRQTEPVFRAFTSLAVRLIPMRQLIEKTKTASIPRSAIGETLTEIASTPSARAAFSPGVIVDYYRDLRALIDAEHFNQVFDTSVAAGGLVGYITGRQFNRGSTDLYQKVLGVSRDGDLQKFIADGLRQLSKKDWLASLSTNDDLLALAFQLHEIGFDLQFGFEFQDAVSDFCDEILARRVDTRLTSEQCDKLVAMLHADQRKTFKRYLAEKIAEGADSLATLLGLFRDSSDDCVFVYEVADKLVREGFARILDRRDVIELEWMRHILEHCPDIRKRSKTSSLNTLNDRVRARLEEELPDNLKSRMIAIANALGLET